MNYNLLLIVYIYSFYNFYLDSINQYDVKMNIPQAMILLSLPMKMKDFINKLVEFVKNE